MNALRGQRRLGGLLLLALVLAGCAELADRQQRSSAAANPAPVVVEVAPALSDTSQPAAQGQATAAGAITQEIATTQPQEASEPPEAADLAEQRNDVRVLCEQIGNKLGSVSVEDCHEKEFVFGGGFSVNLRPLVYRDEMPHSAEQDTHLRVLVLGGIHGDEYSSISILFKWMALFSPDAVEGGFHWRFAPLVNPDGLLDGKQAVRVNANGVDLNRNFPSRDWDAAAARYWAEHTGSNPRRFPGASAGSEPEVQWIVQQIEDFRPDVIVSMHAPYHLLDFDGPAEAPSRIGELYLHQLGVYPGSLGNFAGLNRGIPVVTLELPSAGIMPSSDQISLMWADLVSWLNREGRSVAGL